MGSLLPIGGVVSKLEVAWLVGVVGQVLEVSPGVKLLALLVLFLGCFQHTFYAGGRSTSHAPLHRNSNSVTLVFAWEAVAAMVPHVQDGVTLMVRTPN